jgi:outer membrane lipoprotein LolB
MWPLVWPRAAARGCAVVLLAALASCAVPPKITGQAGETAFSRTGRFAVNVTQGGKMRAVQGGFAWYDNGTGMELDLANPLGSTLARVKVTPGGAVLLRSDGTREYAPSANALVAKVLGSPIPVEGLRDWLRGRVDAQQVTHQEQDAAGKPESFMQNGWSVRLSRYDTQGPTLLRMKRSGADGRVSVRLAVDGG